MARNDDYEKRWVEIQTYYILQDLLSLYQDIKLVLDFVKTLAPIGGFDYEIISTILQRMLVDVRIRPIKQEVVITSYYIGYKVRPLVRKLNIGHSQYYNILEKEKNQPMYITFFVGDFARNECIKFIDTINKFKGVGFEQ